MRDRIHFCHSRKRKQTNKMLLLCLKQILQQIKFEWRKKNSVHDLYPKRSRMPRYVGCTDGWDDSRLLIWVIIMITSYNPCDQQEGMIGRSNKMMKLSLNFRTNDVWFSNPVKLARFYRCLGLSLSNKH